MRSPEAIIAAVQRAISRRFMPLSRIAMASADICSSATSPRVYASMTQSICSSLSSPRSRLVRMTEMTSMTTRHGLASFRIVCQKPCGPPEPVA